MVIKIEIYELLKAYSMQKKCFKPICKRKMCTRRYRGNVYYFCNAAWYRDERKCSHKSISEEKLQKIVRSELTRQFQLSDLRKKDMSAISSAVFLTKIKEIQAEIRKLDADMERHSEKLAQAFMQYKEGELSKEAYIEMKDDRNNWKVFCEDRKKSLEQTIRKLEKQQKKEARFLRSLLELDAFFIVIIRFITFLVPTKYQMAIQIKTILIAYSRFFGVPNCIFHTPSRHIQIIGKTTIFQPLSF